VGAYRDDNGKPVVLDSVQKAVQVRILLISSLCTQSYRLIELHILMPSQKLHDAKLNNEYAAISGIKEFNKHAVDLAYGHSSTPVKVRSSITVDACYRECVIDCLIIVQESRVAAIQSLSGTGALRLIGAFIARFKPMDVYLPTPTWGNHIPIFGDCGLQVPSVLPLVCIIRAMVCVLNDHTPIAG